MPLTTRDVAVRGALETRAASIKLTLERSNGKVVASKTVSFERDGELRPARQALLDTRLPFPTPRPTGATLWVVLVAYDRHGQTLGVVRRAVVVGPLAGRA